MTYTAVSGWFYLFLKGLIKSDSKDFCYYYNYHIVRKDLTGVMADKNSALHHRSKL